MQKGAPFPHHQFLNLGKIINLKSIVCTKKELNDKKALSPSKKSKRINKKRTKTKKLFIRQAGPAGTNHTQKRKANCSNRGLRLQIGPNSRCSQNKKKISELKGRRDNLLHILKYS